MASLPMDIIFTCILPKLPVKSVTRFKCVSRSFLTEISSQKFIKLYHLNASSSDANRIMIIPIDYRRIHMYELDSPHSPPSVCYYPKDLTFIPMLMQIVASCENYLLIASGYTNLEDLILLNPCTRTYRELPRLRIVDFGTCNLVYGLCCILDEFDEDYKVVRFREYNTNEDNYHREVMVYSSKTNMWKFIELRQNAEPILSWHLGTTTALVQNHLLHMILLKEYGLGANMSRVGCFDMKVEKWTHDVQLPDTLSDINDSHVDLGVLDGQLCFLVQNVNQSTYDLWVIKEYGVRESWVKLMSLPICNDQENPLFWEQVFHPLAYRKGSSSQEILYRQGRSCNLIWYNLGDRQGIDAEFTGLPDASPLSTAYICKGSLLNFPGGQPIIEILTEDDEEEDEEQYEDEKEDEEDFVDYLYNSIL